MEPTLEQVFKKSGVPTFTFVEPREYAKLLVGLRTPGRAVVVEGPSGIGKTSAVETALKKLGATGQATKLSARKPADVEYIELLPSLGGKLGTVVVDDFHRLPEPTKAKLGDFLKTLADEERPDIKVVIIGINRAGERLIRFAADLVNRIEIIPLENNPEHKVRELIRLGERALNIEINVADEIVDAAEGSFYIAQLLSHEVCLSAGVLECRAEKFKTSESFESVRAGVWDSLEQKFHQPCRTFCQGPRMKPSGRAPYLHILHWVAESHDWSIEIPEAARSEPSVRGSVIQVVEKGYLGELLSDNAGTLGDLLHYDEAGKRLTIEDPQLVFFLKGLPWARFAREIGFVGVTFEKRYDFALSFAGADRDVAEALFKALSEEDVEVFYDKNEQHRILAEDLEAYLRPIYQSEASYVVCLLGREYPKRIWTKFESDAFKERFADGAVIPVWFADVPSGIFDESRRVGGITFDRDRSLEPQVRDIVKVLLTKLDDARRDSQSSLPAAE